MKRKKSMFSIAVHQIGSTFDDYVRHVRNIDIEQMLHKYAIAGCHRLEDYTPVGTGLLASSWDYKIEIGQHQSKITWLNDDIENGVNVALLVQYGHGTKQGVYVSGIDFINPALETTFDQFAQQLWEEMTSYEQNGRFKSR